MLHGFTLAGRAASLAESFAQPAQRASKAQRPKDRHSERGEVPCAAAGVRASETVAAEWPDKWRTCGFPFTLHKSPGLAILLPRSVLVSGSVCSARDARSHAGERRETGIRP